MRNILADIGLSPQSREEKREVTECIQEKVQKMGCEEFEFEAFLDLLKSVKERMKQVQSIKCWRLFHEADVHGEDNLEMLQVMHLLENKLGFFLASAEEHTEVPSEMHVCHSLEGCEHFRTVRQQRKWSGHFGLQSPLSLRMLEPGRVPSLCSKGQRLKVSRCLEQVRARLLTLRRREEVQIANRWHDTKVRSCFGGSESRGHPLEERQVPWAILLSLHFMWLIVTIMLVKHAGKHNHKGKH